MTTQGHDVVSNLVELNTIAKLNNYKGTPGDTDFKFFFYIIESIYDFIILPLYSIHHQSNTHIKRSSRIMYLTFTHLDENVVLKLQILPGHVVQLTFLLKYTG